MTTSLRRRACVAAALLLFIFGAMLPLQQVSAADEAAPTTAAAGEAGKSGKPAKTVLDIWVEGGPVMYFLAIASIFMVTFTTQGFLTLSAKKLAPPAVVARLRESINAGNYQEAWEICVQNKCFLTNVLKEGLERIGRSKEGIDFAIEEAALRESTVLRTNITYLSVIGVVTPMIGLTGTVVGMIKAFDKLGSSGLGDPSGLASSISEVLIATASGLVVAIPAFIFFYILKARSMGAILVAESEINRLIEDIPVDQLAGVRVGENFSADTAGTHGRRSEVSQRVSKSLTTNCPSCNASIVPGVSPCPNCGSVLEWGA